MNIIAKPIDVVASFTINGIPSPMRFRYQQSEDETVVIKIDNILFKETEKISGNVMILFRCESNVEGISRTYDIKYELATCKWMLYRI